jgi:hypothetical protein
MVERHMPELPLLDRMKIRAEVLIPLFHAFQAELGTERTARVPVPRGRRIASAALPNG